MLQRDRKRVYSLKESKMVNALLEACIIDRNSEAGKSLRRWNQPGTKEAGHFARVAHEVSFLPALRSMLKQAPHSQ